MLHQKTFALFSAPKSSVSMPIIIQNHKSLNKLPSI